MSSCLLAAVLSCAAQSCFWLSNWPRQATRHAGCCQIWYAWILPQKYGACCQSPGPLVHSSTACEQSTYWETTSSMPPHQVRCLQLPHSNGCLIQVAVWCRLCPVVFSSQVFLTTMLWTTAPWGCHILTCYICAGWFTQTPAGMQLDNLTVAATTTVGCLPTSILSGPSLASLELVQAPSANQFPSTQQAVACPVPPFPEDQVGAGYSGSEEAYSAIKQMQVFRITATHSVFDLASLGCSIDRCVFQAAYSIHFRGVSAC